MERFRLLFIALLTLTLTNAYAQCTREQELDMAREGISTTQIDKKCGVSPESDGEAKIVLLDRVVKPGDVIPIIDGTVILHIKEIYMSGETSILPVYIEIPRWSLPTMYFSKGSFYSFHYRRRAYKFYVLGIWLNDQVANIEVHDVGPYTPE